MGVPSPINASDATGDPAASPATPTTPLPLPAQAGAIDPRVRSVLVFGGTFDPPHLAHVELAAAARRSVEARLKLADRSDPSVGTEGLDGVWLLYVPAARSPHKTRGPAASDEHRVGMLRVALAGVPRSAVWTDELDRAPGASYTVDTLRRARRWLDAHAGASVGLWLLIGADQAAAFHRWREPRAILDLAEPVVLLRGEEQSPELLLDTLRQSGFWSEPELARWERGIVRGPTMDVSATAVRAALRRKRRQNAKLLGMLSPAVLEYIDQRGLYREVDAPAPPAGAE
jgi:nicotinate-nucleotide adenylyltransferase